MTRSVGGPWLTASKERGTSVLQLQGTGFSQPPEHVRSMFFSSFASINEDSPASTLVSAL